MRVFSQKRFLIISAIVLFFILLGLFCASRKKSNAQRATVKVERKNIVETALAIGSIEAKNEIAVKSKISGVVGRVFVEVGEFVQKGDPLLEVRPDPTPIELAEAKRNVEMATLEVENVKKEWERAKELNRRGLISEEEFENIKKNFEQAELLYKMAKERLELIEKGKIQIAETAIETVIKAPISGFILERAVNVGDPVVPLTSYQAGTELLRMADMKALLFKGTVDEIDVGKIREGMPVEIQIGALPGKLIKGEVSLISLKARKQENITVFPIEVTITESKGGTLRAGFSATARVIIAQRDSVLALPERVVTFRNDSSFVRIPQGTKDSKEVYIKTGLSDGIYIEVIEGLKEGQEVLEKEVKPIV